jgi:(2Fe-2S) ferredoxin
MEPFRLHLYVCSQQKPEGVPSCPAAGASAVLSAIEREVLARGLDNEVQITTSGCQGLCDEGPMMVVYPEGVWYRKVQPSDATDIVSAHLAGGKPVERLVWRDAPTMKAMSAEHRDKFRIMMAAKAKSGASE